jgi:putative transposase
VANMCRWLLVSRSGYYKWRCREPCQQAVRREHVGQAVIVAFNQFKKRYGAPRGTVELNESGVHCSLNHIMQLMAETGLKARNGKNYRYFPSPNIFNHLSGNLLQRDFTASKPNEKRVSDITCVRVKGGHVYLAVILDLFSRQIIGWAMDTNMATDLIIEAFQIAVAKRQVRPGLILYSDRGVQYRSGEYQRQLLDEGIQPSMSRKGITVYRQAIVHNLCVTYP